MQSKWRASPSKPSRAKRYGTMIDTHLRRTIQSEAKKLGISPAEYINLSVGVAKNIRESFGSGQEKDAHQLLNIIQNPVFVILLRTFAESFLKQMSTDKETKTDTEPNQSSVQGTQAPSTMKTRAAPQYYDMWNFW